MHKELFEKVEHFNIKQTWRICCLTTFSDLLVRHERLNHSDLAETNGQTQHCQQRRPESASGSGDIHRDADETIGDSLCQPSVLTAISVDGLRDQNPESPTYGPPLGRMDDFADTLNANGLPGGSEEALSGFSPSLPAQISMFPHPGFLSDSFQDLAAFMDNLTPFTDDFESFISPTQGLSFMAPEEHCHSDAFALLSADSTTKNITQQADETEFFSSRLPSLQPEERILHFPQNTDSRNLFDQMNSHTRGILLDKLQEYSSIIPEAFQLPSRLALSRYLTAYVKGFHEHMPILHLPTMSVDMCYIELVLAIASIGAQYCFEPEKTVQLFQASHAIARERIRIRDASLRPRHVPQEILNQNQCPDAPPRYGETIQTAQALFLLMAEATWSNHPRILREALAIQSILATLVRDDGLKSTPLPKDASWTEWSIYESTKRTKWIVFCFFNLHTIVYNIPSPILSSDVDGMLLPCHTAAFRATSESKWSRSMQKETEVYFKDAFSLLFKDDFTVATIQPNSTLGNYILVHALIQHIYLVREVSRHRRKEVLEEDISSIELALRNWKSTWKHTPDSSIDPSNPAGPVSFNSTALLRLAYIRLNADIGPGRALHTRDPEQIAAAFLKAQIISRTPRLLRAVLHAAHALSIPIRIGIYLVAQTQTFRWSIQHSLATLECAFLLSKWLEALSSPVAIETITPGEHKMVMLVKTMLDETDFAVPSSFSIGSPSGMKLLSANVLRVWAKAFYGPAQVWAIVDIVRVSLELCADSVENM